MRIFLSLVVLALLVALSAVSYRVARERLAADIYRQRLQALSNDYELLRSQYNTAVEKTAVTELWVEDGALSVVVTSAAGELRRVPTPFDPSDEIHVDFVVLDGRLWIRRVYDAHTPAKDGLVIEPSLADVNWDDAGAVYGVSVYRPLAEGHWVIDVTGNGALSLMRKENDARPTLVHAPAVREAPPIERALEEGTDHIGFSDMVSALWAD